MEQAQAWPIAVNGQDLIAVAKTGSGKTLGYVLARFAPIFHLGTPESDNEYTHHSLDFMPKIACPSSSFSLKAYDSGPESGRART
jgi:hypothetical protein